MSNEFIFPLGRSGRLISHSKSEYLFNNPGNKIIFNANVCTKDHGKLWYGDLDLTKDTPALKKFAEHIEHDLYVFRELDFCFDKQDWDKVDTIIPWQ